MVHCFNIIEINYILRILSASHQEMYRVELCWLSLLLKEYLHVLRLLRKESLNSDSKQFYQYQQSKQFYQYQQSKQFYQYQQSKQTTLS